MKRSLIHLTALAALAGISVATAGHAGQALGKNAMFERFDLNTDGLITRDEARTALTDRFARMDADADGVVTRSEQKALRKDQRFRRMDKNGDGGVTLAEMEAGMMRHVHDRFIHLDRDGNGVVTQDEVRQARTGRKARNAAMTIQDLDARVMRMFDRADENRDGVITSEEANLMRDHGQRN